MTGRILFMGRNGKLVEKTWLCELRSFLCVLARYYWQDSPFVAVGVSGCLLCLVKRGSLIARFTYWSSTLFSKGMVLYTGRVPS